MYCSWVADITNMHDHYEFHEKVQFLSPEELRKLLEFRIRFLEEELTEIKDAKGAEDVVDGLIDLIVVAIGTLDLFEIDSEYAWDQVHEANMSKKVGIKESRPNPLGLPDLIKPSDFKSPDHTGNIGTLSKIFTICNN